MTGNIAKFAPQAKAAASENRGGIVDFEIMPKNINKVVQANEAVVGDVATNLALLLPYVKETPSRPEWFSQINDWKKRLPFAYDRETPEGLIKPQTVIETLSNLTADIKHRSESTPRAILFLPTLVLDSLRKAEAVELHRSILGITVTCTFENNCADFGL